MSSSNPTERHRLLPSSSISPSYGSSAHPSSSSSSSHSAPHAYEVEAERLISSRPSTPLPSSDGGNHGTGGGGRGGGGGGRRTALFYILTVLVLAAIIAFTFLSINKYRS